MSKGAPSINRLLHESYRKFSLKACGDIDQSKGWVREKGEKEKINFNEMTVEPPGIEFCRALPKIEVSSIMLKREC